VLRDGPTQVPHEHLALDLETDDEEEDCHQPIVDPMQEALWQDHLVDADRQAGLPEGDIGGCDRGICPEERDDRRDDQQDPAGGSAAGELVEWCEESVDQRGGSHPRMMTRQFAQSFATQPAEGGRRGAPEPSASSG